jgi:hypothetical protein
MARIYDNGIIVATGFKLDDPRPLDDKDIVATFSDLLTLQYAYLGITVKVEDEDYTPYTWFQGVQNVSGNWKTTGGGGSDTDAIHINVADEFTGSLQAELLNQNNHLLIEDANDSFNKKYINLYQVGLIKQSLVDSVTIEGTTSSFDCSEQALQIDISGSVNNMTLYGLFGTTTDMQISYALINNQRLSDVTINLINVDQFEGTLTQFFAAPPGLSRLEYTYFRGTIICALRGDVGAGGGDADTLQGLTASQFLRSDIDDQTTGQLTISASQSEQLRLGYDRIQEPSISFYTGFAQAVTLLYQANSGSPSGSFNILNNDLNTALRIRNGINGLVYDSVQGVDSYIVFHQGNFSSQGGVTRTLISGTSIGSTYTINWNNNNEYLTTGSLTVNQNTTFSFSNDANAQLALIDILITGATRSLVFPSSTRMQNSESRWTTATKTLSLEVGQYKMTIHKYGSLFSMECSDLYI